MALADDVAEQRCEILVPGAHRGEVVALLEYTCNSDRHGTTIRDFFWAGESPAPPHPFPDILAASNSGEVTAMLALKPIVFSLSISVLATGIAMAQATAALLGKFS